MKERRPPTGPGGLPFVPAAGEFRGKMPVASKNCLGVAGLEVIGDRALFGDADCSRKEDIAAIASSSFFLRDGASVLSRQ